MGELLRPPFTNKDGAPDANELCIRGRHNNSSFAPINYQIIVGDTH